jgi:cyclophilin family peptidyl-prolyl cis-trans isomerase
MKKSFAFLLIAGLTLAGCTSSKKNDGFISASNPPQSSPINNSTNKKGTTMKTLADFQPIEATQVTLKTSKGDITFKLFQDQAPLTTLNFLTLAKDGFYDGVVFHRVIPDFMAQVGDPLSKDEAKKSSWGTGGPGYSIADEFSAELTHNKAGIVSMANSGPNSGGSQFFITYEPTTWLDGKHAVFGEVTSGMDVLEQITIGDKITSVTYQ